MVFSLAVASTEARLSCIRLVSRDLSLQAVCGSLIVPFDEVRQAHAVRPLLRESVVLGGVHAPSTLPEHARLALARHDSIHQMRGAVVNVISSWRSAFGRFLGALAPSALSTTADSIRAATLANRARLRVARSLVAFDGEEIERHLAVEVLDFHSRSLMVGSRNSAFVAPDNEAASHASFTGPLRVSGNNL